MPWPEEGKKQKKKERSRQKILQKVTSIHSDIVNVKRVCGQSL